MKPGSLGVTATVLSFVVAVKEAQHLAAVGIVIESAVVY